DAQDAESRMRLRSIDVQLLRLLEEISTGRQETTIALRQQLERLTSAILMTSEQEDKGN
ncbi:MAG: biopolymer transporter ExbB, partial [Rhodobacteraceae bacterium]|nr:biopolymer transporter ExbB [Paracoccaceae bacterium]